MIWRGVHEALLSGVCLIRSRQKTDDYRPDAGAIAQAVFRLESTKDFNARWRDGELLVRFPEGGVYQRRVFLWSDNGQYKRMCTYWVCLASREAAISYSEYKSPCRRARLPCLACVDAHGGRADLEQNMRLVVDVHERYEHCRVGWETAICLHESRVLWGL